MKKLLVLLACVAALAGCRTPTTAQQCAKNAATYEAYIQALKDGAVLNETQVNQARLAAVFLNLYCAWQAPAGLTKGDKDDNGVLIVRRP